MVLKDLGTKERLQGEALSIKEMQKKTPPERGRGHGESRAGGGDSDQWSVGSG